MTRVETIVVADAATYPAAPVLCDKRKGISVKRFAIVTIIAAAAVLAPGQVQVQNAGAGKGKAVFSSFEELA